MLTLTYLKVIHEIWFLNRAKCLITAHVNEHTGSYQKDHITQSRKLNYPPKKWYNIAI
jgi:hypothetical protein